MRPRWPNRGSGCFVFGALEEQGIFNGRSRLGLRGHPKRLDESRRARLSDPETGYCAQSVRIEGREQIPAAVAYPNWKR